MLGSTFRDLVSQLLALKVIEPVSQGREEPFGVAARQAPDVA